MPNKHDTPPSPTTDAKPDATKAAADSKDTSPGTPSSLERAGATGTGFDLDAGGNPRGKSVEPGQLTPEQIAGRSLTAAGPNDRASKDPSEGPRPIAAAVAGHAPLPLNHAERQETLARRAAQANNQPVEGAVSADPDHVSGPKVRAKFTCISVDGGQVRLQPVTNGSQENKRFFDATPTGSITLGIKNSNAAKYFAPGAEYLIDFTRVPKEGEKPPKA